MEDEYRKRIVEMIDSLDEEMLRKVYSYTKVKFEVQTARKTEE